MVTLFFLLLGCVAVRLKKKTTGVNTNAGPSRINVPGSSQMCMIMLDLMYPGRFKNE